MMGNTKTVISYYIVSFVIAVACASCTPSGAFPSKGTVRCTTHYFSITVPTGWEFRFSDDSLILTTADKSLSVVLVPTLLAEAETAEQVLETIAQQMRQGNQNRRVLSIRRGEFHLRGCSAPAVFAQVEARQQGRWIGMEEMSLIAEKQEGWVVGVTVIARGTISHHQAQVARVLDTLEVNSSAKVK